MRQFITKTGAGIIGFFIFMLTAMAVQAQDKIEIDTEGVGSWFERNWMWVAGVALLVLFIVLLGRNRKGSRHDSRRTTTVIKDAQGNTKSVTTKEENI